MPQMLRNGFWGEFHTALLLKESGYLKVFTLWQVDIVFI